MFNLKCPLVNEPDKIVRDLMLEYQFVDIVISAG